MFIAFFGADSKVGTTQVAQSFARAVARNNPDDKVLFLILTGQDDGTYISRPKEMKGLDEVYEDLKNGTFTKEKLAKACFSERNFNCFGGVKSFMRFTRKSFTPILLEGILRAADGFDHIIADCGNDIEFGMAVYAMSQKTDLNFFVGTLNKTCLVRMGKKITYFNAASKLLPIHAYIINKHDQKKHGRIDEVCTRLSLPEDNTFKVSFSPKGEAAENDRKLIYDLDRNFRKDIDDISRDIVESAY